MSQDCIPTVDEETFSAEVLACRGTRPGRVRRRVVPALPRARAGPARARGGGRRAVEGRRGRHGRVTRSRREVPCPRSAHGAALRRRRRGGPPPRADATRDVPGAPESRRLSGASTQLALSRTSAIDNHARASRPPHVLEVDGPALDALPGALIQWAICFGSRTALPIRLCTNASSAVARQPARLAPPPTPAWRSPCPTGRRACPRRGRPGDGSGGSAAQLERHAVRRDRAVPPVDAALAVLDVRVAQDLVHRVAERHLLRLEAPVLRDLERVASPSSARWSSYCSSLGRPLRPAAKKPAAFELISPPKRSSESEYQRFRYRCIVGRSMTPSARTCVGVLLAVLGHQLRRAVDDAQDARLADEHVVRLLGEHEAGRARQRDRTRSRPARGAGTCRRGR